MRLVEVHGTTNRFEADVIAVRLRDAGVEAVVFGADAEGWAPHLTMCAFHRVMVPEDALDFALELLGPQA